jgi:hypothetical protein
MAANEDSGRARTTSGGPFFSVFAILATISAPDIRPMQLVCHPVPAHSNTLLGAADSHGLQLSDSCFA